MNDEQLLAEVEDLLRSSPPQSAFMERENDKALGWLGRTAAVLNKWDLVQSSGVSLHIRALQAAPKQDLISLSPETRDGMIAGQSNP